ncbi:integral membrane protein [Aspergillus luchuensis]|uniref:Integral membrane protein n=1 Tax=Aspergillus kawachii TaxID=1069201 RepID=A0A146F646_ASPKA|nr:integral membrane protein [Aspergillus luchuensis]
MRVLRLHSGYARTFNEIPQNKGDGRQEARPTEPSFSGRGNAKVGEGSIPCQRSHASRDSVQVVK